ncbi:MAG TPA: GNAT family N-acetyltransferase [Spirochaetota bacterium]|nr:GNAT family N-acetyltransferase [Spirochaetota bacterium]HPJ35482.1 GNAT family N-acetyltransferase [Spirochaetota bacterium]
MADFEDKFISVSRALGMIKPGSKIFFSSGPAVPDLFASALTASDETNLQDLELVQLITLNEYIKFDQEHGNKYRLKTFSTGQSIIKRIQSGEIDFIPANLVEIPYIFSRKALKIDVAVVTTSPPDDRGFMSLGIASDVAKIVINHAKLVIAEVNPAMPVTFGDTFIHADQVDCMIKSDLPLPERERKPFDDVLGRIGFHISNIVDDESTVVLHVGRIFDAIAHHLKSKKELGIFTNVISDWVIDLIESGAVSVDRNRYKGGLVTTSYCYGTRELYRYISGNPVFEFYPIAILANPMNIRRVNNLVSIMNVKKIDVTGEQVVFHSGDNLLSGYESKLNFSVGAAFARNGRSVVALRSTDRDGNSNIVITHDDSADMIRGTLGVTRHVVTEYGVANLFGKSIRERVIAMIDIAHPEHREALLEKAKSLGYAYRDQIYIKDFSVNYPEDLELVKSFGPDLDIKFRPVKSSDEDMMRELFYQFSDEAKYLRYFARINTMPHRNMQKYVNVDYDKVLSIVGVVESGLTEKIIAEARYAYYEYDGSYEMAFIVNEEFQGRGIASFLLEYLLQIAESRGIETVTANVLYGNSKMIKVFKRGDRKPEISVEDGVMVFRYKLERE